MVLLLEGKRREKQRGMKTSILETTEAEQEGRIIDESDAKSVTIRIAGEWRRYWSQRRSEERVLKYFSAEGTE